MVFLWPTTRATKAENFQVLADQDDQVSKSTSRKFKKRKAWQFPNLVVLNLVVCNIYTEALFCVLLRPFTLLHLRSLCSFVLFCAHLRASANDRV